MSGISWRGYQAADEAALRAAHARQCAALGERFAFPDFNDPRYLLTSVAERDGRVLGAVTAHATLEVMFVGGDALTVRSAVGQQEVWRHWLLALGADEAHAFVPRAALPGMGPLLRRLGFTRSNENYVPFYRAL